MRSARQRTNPHTGREPGGQPMVILHGIWMAEYKGWERKIWAPGFKFPAENGWGGEIFNFDTVNGKRYGHVEIVQRKIAGKLVDPQLRIEALGAEKSADVVHGVLVVWTAPDPRKRGRTIIGWYKNASVYRHRQTPSGSLKRKRTFEGYVCSYRAVADAKDCVLLPPEERHFTIPRRRHGQTGVPGQFGAFYPASSNAAGHKIEQDIRRFIQTGKAPIVSTRRGGRFQIDPERRKEIEEKAIKFVWDHFKDELNYVMDDRQKDDLGYDLIATSGDEILCIEVKGRSGSDVIADFSPNEYERILSAQKARFTDGSYRICIVTEALSNPKLHHFMCWPPTQGRRGDWWTIDGKRRLTLRPVMAARGSALDEAEAEG